MAEIEVQKADITKLEVDAIANAANTELKHGGGVAGSDLPRRRSDVQQESDELAPIGLGEAVATSAGEMPSRWVIHAATMELGGPTSAEIIRRRPLDPPRGGRTRRHEPRAGRLRHRRRRLPPGRGGTDRGRGGSPPPRRAATARARRLRGPRRRRTRRVHAARQQPDLARGALGGDQFATPPRGSTRESRSSRPRGRAAERQQRYTRGRDVGAPARTEASRFLARRPRRHAALGRALDAQRLGAADRDLHRPPARRPSRGPGARRRWGPGAGLPAGSARRDRGRAARGRARRPRRRSAPRRDESRRDTGALRSAPGARAGPSTWPAGSSSSRQAPGAALRIGWRRCRGSRWRTRRRWRRRQSAASANPDRPRPAAHATVGRPVTRSVTRSVTRWRGTRCPRAAARAPRQCRRATG